MHGPHILEKPLDNSQMVPSMSDDNDDSQQKSFEDASFTTDNEKSLDLKTVVHMEEKKNQEVDHVPNV